MFNGRVKGFIDTEGPCQVLFTGYLNVKLMWNHRSETMIRVILVLYRDWDDILGKYLMSNYRSETVIRVNFGQIWWVAIVSETMMRVTFVLYRIRDDILAINWSRF